MGLATVGKLASLTASYYPDGTAATWYLRRVDWGANAVFSLEIVARLVLRNTAADRVWCLVVCPWAAVTRGDEPLATEEPHDALLVTDPRLAAQWLYPAIDPQQSRTKRDDPEITARARALLTDDAALQKPEGRAARLLSYLTQPFACAEPDTGWAGLSVPAEQTHRDVARLLDGDLDAIPLDDLRYRGALPS